MKLILKWNSIYLLYFTSLLHIRCWDEFDSSSTNWELSPDRQQSLRQVGYCVKNCGFGFDKEADGYDNFIHHYFKTKKESLFRQLVHIMIFSPVPGNLTDVFLEIDDGDYEMEVRSQKTLAKLVDIYCNQINADFDTCNRMTEELISQENGEKCLYYCEKEVFHRDLDPKVNEIALERKEYEECLKSFRGPEEVFDFNNKEETTIENLLTSLQKFGFITIKNFFSKELMNEVNEIMNTWDVTGQWKNYTFAEFYSHNPGQLSKYENRREIVLPDTEPFTTLLSTVHNSIIMELLHAYGNHLPVHLDFPATIMSYPGAEQQNTHGDHGIEASMVKVTAAIHDVHEKSGPTSFCPCTQKHGINHVMYNKACGIRYHPEFLSAGTVIIYDMSVKHRGSANNGDIRRYILDLSYTAGDYSNRYHESYPETAQKYVLMYREKYQNL